MYNFDKYRHNKEVWKKTNSDLREKNEKLKKIIEHNSEELKKIIEKKDNEIKELKKNIEFLQSLVKKEFDSQVKSN